MLERPMCEQNGRARTGFTLIEILVVISIITVLAAILFPVFARVREQARKATCQSNLKQIGLGVMMYVQDYDERFPMRYMYPESRSSTGEAGWFFFVLQPYISKRGRGVWICPTAGPLGKSSGGYGWNICGDSQSSAVVGHGFGFQSPNYCTPSGTAGVMQTEVTMPARTILAGDPSSNGYDGNAQNLFPSWWQSQLPVLHGGQVGPFYDPDGNARAAGEPRSYEGGGNYLFADGHVKFLQNSHVWANRVELFRVDK